MVPAVGHTHSRVHTGCIEELVTVGVQHRTKILILLHCQQSNDEHLRRKREREGRGRGEGGRGRGEGGEKTQSSGSIKPSIAS